MTIKKSLILNILLITSITCIVLFFSCKDSDNQTSDNNNNTTTEAIIGTWECPAPLAIGEDTPEQYTETRKYYENGTFIITTNVKNLGDDNEYTFQSGNYYISGLNLTSTILKEGTSYTSIDDAQENTTEANTETIRYFYADNDYFSNLEVYERILGDTDTIVGNWKNVYSTDLIESTVVIELSDSGAVKYNFTDIDKVTEDEETGWYLSTYTIPADGRFSSEINDITFVVDYVILNDGNILILEPCTRVE